MLAHVFDAAAPRPELAARLSLFAPLIGSWALVVEDHGRDGSCERREGEWHFGWALDGRAVADVWICPTRAARAQGAPDGEWGLSVRFFDPSIDAWRSTWHGPLRGLVIPFIARPSPGGLTLEGEHDGTVLRWIFTDVTDDRFEWRAEEHRPGDAPFIRQRFHASRQS